MAEKYNFNQNNSDADDDIAYIYNEVSKAIREGLPLTSFDIDTLIDVHDYAYDIHDDFVAEELMTNVLSRSSRCLPMLERKAMAYLRFGDIVAAKIIAAKMPRHSFIYKLIEAQSLWDTDNWKESYKALLSNVKPNSIDDFGAVSIIDFALDKDEVSHIVDVLPILLPLMRYPEDFLYDLSNILADDKKYEDAARVLQELTTIQSFNIDYWLQLADIYINQLDNYEEGKNALDYAFAISPDSHKGLLLQGELLMKTDGPAQKILDIADKIVSDKTYSSQANFLKAGVYIREYQSKEAIRCLDLCFDEASDKLNHLLLIFSLMGENVDRRHLDMLRQVLSETDEPTLESWILKNRKIVDNSTFGIILNELEKTGREFSDGIHDMILYNYYANGEYGKVISGYEAQYHDRPVVGSGYIYIYSLIRTGFPEKQKLMEMTDTLLALSSAEFQNTTATEAMTLIQSVKTGLSLKEFLTETKGNDYNLGNLDKIDYFVSFDSDVS